MRVLIVVLGLIYAASAAPRQSRIVGGEATTIEKFPFMAGILTQLEWGGFYQSCGGTLVTRTAVVSAGHCFPSTAAASSRVRLGSTYRSSGGTEHVVSRITVHELYNASIVINDVSVVRLRNPAVYSDQIQSARIVGPRYQLHTNSVLDTIGWGDLERGGNSSEILQHVALKVIDQQICTERYAYLRSQPETSYIPEVTTDMVCKGILDVGGKASCQGDSGGPVLQQGDVLVAITSWSYSCDHPVYPGVGVRVSSYSEWIVKHSIN